LVKKEKHNIYFEKIYTFWKARIRILTIAFGIPQMIDEDNTPNLYSKKIPKNLRISGCSQNFKINKKSTKVLNFFLNTIPKMTFVVRDLSDKIL